MREQLLDMLGHRPFTPIQLFLSDGTVHMIRHPDQALVGPSYVIIGVPGHNGPGPDVARTITVSLLHVTHVSIADQTVAGAP